MADESLVVETEEVVIIVSDSFEQAISGGVILEPGDILNGGNAFSG